jgi:hypothetical protein
MHELHPHAFRKYFFTKLIVAGVDRGVAEYLMGHKFGLDSPYLRMDEERLRKEYMKAENDFSFLTEPQNLQPTSPEIIREEVRRILREQGPELMKELTKET